MRKIKILHLEPTDVCQLACPACAREVDPTFKKSTKHHLRIENIEQHYTKDDIIALEKMYMCGVYGDPAAGYYTLDIYRWFRSINPDITLGMNSNGALQSTFWWYELGKLLNKQQDYVVFSIDGLEDTNHVYRVNSNWSKLMSNVQSFISAGGNAHWDMLVYKHNQHQVSQCEQLARDMGFKWFRAKVSRRPLTSILEYPVEWHVPKFSPGKISCQAIQENSAYIDSKGKLYPCCWMPDKEDKFNDLQNGWNSSMPNLTCVETCSTNQETNVFKAQWQKEIKLTNT